MNFLLHLQDCPAGCRPCDSVDTLPCLFAVFISYAVLDFLNLRFTAAIHCPLKAIPKVLPTVCLVIAPDFLLLYLCKADSFLTVGYRERLWVGNVFTSCRPVNPASPHLWVISFFQTDELLEGVNSVIPEFDRRAERRDGFKNTAAPVFSAKSMFHRFRV